MDVKEQEAPPTVAESDYDDDPPTLSSYTLEALREFLDKQNSIAAAAASAGATETAEVSLLSEDWRLSQFWYTPETAETVAQEVLHLLNHLTGDSPAVACISCPTLYAYLKNLDPHVSAQLLE
ncbi:hypothetical protein Dimus_007372 [Dionaea muscipula]